MKYNYTSYDDDGQKLYKGIIELEPIDEPKSQLISDEHFELLKNDMIEYYKERRDHEKNVHEKVYGHLNDKPKEETHFDEIYEEARQNAPESKMAKHIEETLEEKMDCWLCGVSLRDSQFEVAKKMAQIAKEHYQEHPNEIVNLSYKQKWHKTGYNMGREDALSGMVSHSKVMEVFKNTHTPVECNWDCNECYNSVRTALQNMS